MIAHTPGPWTALIDPGPRGMRPCAMVTTGTGVLAIDCGDSGADYEQDCANARLIAAAPDLLAVCNALLAWHEDPTADDHCWSQVRDAIAKATGQAVPA